MSADELEALFQFFGGYFNQDWDLDDPDESSVVRRFAAESRDPEAVSRLASMAEKYALLHEDDESLERDLFGQLGCYYVPSAIGLSAREWLFAVAAKLRATAKPTRPPGD